MLFHFRSDIFKSSYPSKSKITESGRQALYKGEINYQGSSGGEIESPGSSKGKIESQGSRGKPWEAADEEMVAKRFREGVSIDIIARDLGRTPNAIRNRLKKIGLT